MMNSILRFIKEKYPTSNIETLAEKTPQTYISSGSGCVNRILGGGFPQGKVTEIYGEAGVGRTTLGLCVIREMQKMGGVCVYIDADNQLSNSWCTVLGVADSLLVADSFDSMEAAMDVLQALMRCSGIALIVYSSVASLPSNKDTIYCLYPAKEKSHRAEVMGVVTRNYLATPKPPTLIFINQVRESFIKGKKHKTTTGRALSYVASVRLELSTEKLLTSGDYTTGQLVRVNIIKNSCNTSYTSGVFTIDYSRGVID